MVLKQMKVDKITREDSAVNHIH